MAETEIHDVSDTALWVAVYRAQESERPDALFRDPYAGLLAGDKGRRIAAMADQGPRYSGWSIVIRTVIIDNYIHKLIAEGVDTVVNLGAGLDTRPYRLNLPPTLRWIEVDFPHMIELKNTKLAGEKPTCRLERVAVDLSDDTARRAFLAKIGSETKHALILTEGVAPYLTPEQVTALANDLRAQPSFRHWIVDYFSPKIFRYFNSRKRRAQMKNAPFQFMPQDWFGFFDRLGWKARETRYIGEESERHGRTIPLPWIFRMLTKIFAGGRAPEQAKRTAAYVLLEPKDR